MLGDRPVMAFVATSDGERARRFYEGTLGLRVVSDEPWALVLDAGGTALRVQKLDAVAPQPFTILGWTVADVAAAVDELGRRGVRFERYAGMDQDQRAIWPAPSGARVAWFKDP